MTESMGLTRNADTTQSEGTGVRLALVSSDSPARAARRMRSDLPTSKKDEISVGGTKRSNIVDTDGQPKLMHGWC